MPLLLEADYARLADCLIAFEEGEQQRFVVFTRMTLTEGMYTVANCDALVMIPPNYNQAGNDMFWTFPRLTRSNGNAIPQTADPGFSDNRVWNGKEFCRWSRHWNPPHPGIWRPGKDDIMTIYRRVAESLRNPDAQ